MKRILIASAIVSLAALANSQASAHAFLTTASPKVGSTVTRSPSQIRLNFTEGLVPAFSSVVVDGPNGSPIAAGKPRISGKVMVVPVTRPLAPGAYHVIWHATAVDTHKTQGSFDFNVQP